VSDILSFSTASVQPTPDVVADSSQSFVPSVLMMDGRMISLISIEGILPASQRDAA
jgi:purine-binding chemotaxis protein CheW